MHFPILDFHNKKGRQANDYGCQYRPIDSPVHRLSAGLKLLLGTILGIAAMTAQAPWSLSLVGALNAVYYFGARLSLADLWRDTRYLFIQMMVVVGLYAIRYGIPAGLWPGLRVALQIFMFFVPGIVFLRTTQASRMMRELDKVIPYRLSFLVYTSLRFVPLFAREIRDIRMAQQLRGARLAPRDLLNPGNWKDMFHCLMIPLLVRALRIADEASRSAEARGFGRSTKRTYFDPMILSKAVANNEQSNEVVSS